jgi:hypothetical protein
MPCGKTEQWAKSREKTDLKKRGGAGAKAAVIKKIQAEAKKNGATLQSDGKGGVDPNITLQVFRRDKFRCQNKDCPSPKKDITLDHISGHPKEIAKDPKAKNRADLKKGIKLGHVDAVAALHTLCAACHNSVHSREREIDAGKKPQPMRGE